MSAVNWTSGVLDTTIDPIDKPYRVASHMLAAVIPSVGRALQCKAAQYGQRPNSGLSGWCCDEGFFQVHPYHEDVLFDIIETRWLIGN